MSTQCLLCVIRVHLCNSGAYRIPRMNHHPIAEAQFLPGLERHAAVARLVVLKVRHAEDVGRKHAVTPRMPVRGMPWVPGMVEDRDAEFLFLEFAGIVGPVRALAAHF